MSKQVQLHNEVILFGRLMNRQKDIRCNNKKAIKVQIALPNADNYDLNSNIAYIYVYDDGQIYDQLRINQAIGINGHIESKWGQKIIVDVLSFIKEPANS